MILLLILIYAFRTVRCISVDPEKVEFCNTLQCNQNENKSVCGIRTEGEGFRLKLFQNECDLLKYGCEVDEKNEDFSNSFSRSPTAYGLINLEYCRNKNPTEHILDNSLQQSSYKESLPCTDYDCSYPGDAEEVCGIRKFEDGYKIKYFRNKCDLLKYNCEKELEFTVTDMKICTGEAPHDIVINNDINRDNRRNIFELPSTKSKLPKNLIVVDGSMLDYSGNVNETIENFFAATHILDLPMMEMGFAEQTRRRMPVKNLKPTKIFVPWIVRPANVSEDAEHLPLLSACFHKCPKKCPDVYSPVCGVPGVMAHEPSLMFQNHCFMDAAQCKMWTENLSPTAQTSAYIESSFLFCLGDRMNGLYRFLPLLRTLQKMGRLKKKGKFQYILRSMRNFNPMMSFEPHAQG